MKKHIYTITLIVLLLDQLVKYIVISNMTINKSIEMIPHFFSLSYVENFGGAWGIFNSSTWLLTLVGATAIILLNQYLLKQNKFTKLSITAYGLFMGGILGNFIDRLVRGYVIDYLDFYIFGYDFPVFNIADIAIVVSVFLFILETVRSDTNESGSRRRIKN